MDFSGRNLPVFNLFSGRTAADAQRGPIRGISCEKIEVPRVRPSKICELETPHRRQTSGCDGLLLILSVPYVILTQNKIGAWKPDAARRRPARRRRKKRCGNQGSKSIFLRIFIVSLFRRCSTSRKQHSRCIPPGINALNLVEGCASKRLRSAACRRKLQGSRRHRLRPAITFLFGFEFRL